MYLFLSKKTNLAFRNTNLNPPEKLLLKHGTQRCICVKVKELFYTVNTVHWRYVVKVKLSHYKPGQALRAPGG
jgi:hypothetical protein